MKRWSIRGRLTAAILAVVALALALFALTLFTAVQNAAWQQQDDGLLARARAVGNSAEHDEDGYEIHLPTESPGSRATYTEVWLSDGTVLARSSSLDDRDLPRLSANQSGHPRFSDLTLPDGRTGRAVEIQYLPRNEGSITATELTLVLAEGSEDVNAALASVRAWFAVIGVVALIAIGFMTVWLLARGLQPLTQLAAKLETLNGEKLATRLAIEGQPRELEAPVNKLNELLARLEALFSRERQFTADVSHELRTPLAGLRTLLEVTALTDRSTSDYKTAVADSLAIVVQLGALVQDLLVLARIDNGQLEIEARQVSLRELVDACWRPHAEAEVARALTFTNAVPAETIASTDREKLRIIVGNVLANAAEYTATGGSIQVTAGPGDVMLDVIDSGPAIPSDQVDKIFDRLWRGDAARSSTGLHCGIGLSLARSLCTRLSLTITAANRADGSVRFRIAKR